MTTKITNAHKVKVGRSEVKVGRIVNGPARGHLAVKLKRAGHAALIFAIRERSLLALVGCYCRVIAAEKATTATKGT